MAKKPHKDQMRADSKSTHLGKNATSQTRGQFERDPKGRKGQYGGAGDSPLIKK